MRRGVLVSWATVGLAVLLAGVGWSLVPPGSDSGEETLRAIPGSDRYLYATRRKVCLSAARDPKCRKEEFVGSSYVVRLPEAGRIEKLAVEAHDAVGNYHRAGLRVVVGGREIQGGPFLDVQSQPTRERWYDLGIVASEVVFEEIRGDEAVITAVEIEYVPRSGQESGWVSYPEAAACIGGSRCGGTGRELVVELEPRPVERVRFHAHDDVGRHSGAHLAVRIDASFLAADIDVPKHGDTFELAAGAQSGRLLIFQVLNDDEAVIDEVAVDYRGAAGTVRERYYGRERKREKRPPSAPGKPNAFGVRMTR